MSLADLIKTQAGGAAGVVAIVGDRLHHGRRPRGAVFPCLTYQIISRPPENTQEGRSSLGHAVVQFTGWGQSPADATAAAAAVRSAAGLLGRSGTLAGGLEGEEPELGLFYDIVTVDVWYRREEAGEL